MPSLSVSPLDVFEDKRKWYRIWWDNIRSLDKYDLVPSIIIGGGVGYGLFTLGLIMLTFSVSTGGLGLGVLALGAVSWQIFKYPVKRLAANIVSPFVEKPKWGLSIDENVKSLESYKNTSSLAEGQLKLENKTLSDYAATAEKKLKTAAEDAQVLTGKFEALCGLKAEQDKHIGLKETELKLAIDLNKTQKQLFDLKLKTSIEEVTQKYKDDADSVNQEHEQQIQDLKHEHDKTTRSLNHKLKKSAEMIATLKARNSALVSQLEVLGAPVNKPPSYEETSDGKSRSPSPTPAFFKSKSSESDVDIAPVAAKPLKTPTIGSGSISD